MPVDRAVLMYVGNDVALCMLMNRMLLIVAVMVMAVHACCGLRDEGPLNGKRQCGRHHHDVGAPSKQGRRTQAQLTRSQLRYQNNANLHQRTERVDTA